jgi:hypothetical protein
MRRSGDSSGSPSGAPPSFVPSFPAAATGSSSVVPSLPFPASFRDVVSQGRVSGFSQVVREAPDPVIPVPQEATVREGFFRSNALFCRFNGLWPRLADLHSWIASEWTPLLEEEAHVRPCVKGFFVVIFASSKDRDLIYSSRPWFWGRSGLSVQLWTPSFDPSSASIPSAPVWVRLPGLPIHFWGDSSLSHIGNALGKFHSSSPETKWGFTTYARICVEMDFNKGFPARITLQGKNYSWTQKLDYENIHFRCRNCFETGHLANNCQKLPEKNRNPKSQRKPTWWAGALPEHQSIEPANDTPDEEDTEVVPQKTEQATSVQEQVPPSPKNPKGKAQAETDPTIMPGISQPEHQTSSWADLADEEGPLCPTESQSQDQSKEWQTVSKRKKNFQVRKDVMTRSRTGSLK